MRHGCRFATTRLYGEGGLEPGLGADQALTGGFGRPQLTVGASNRAGWCQGVAGEADELVRVYGVSQSAMQEFHRGAIVLKLRWGLMHKPSAIVLLYQDNEPADEEFCELIAHIGLGRALSEAAERKLTRLLTEENQTAT